MELFNGAEMGRSSAATLRPTRPVWLVPIA
jgi:hypothetical protein